MTKKTIKFLKIMQDIMSSGDYRELAGEVLKVKGESGQKH